MKGCIITFFLPKMKTSSFPFNFCLFIYLLIALHVKPETIEKNRFKKKGSRKPRKILYKQKIQGVFFPSHPFAHFFPIFFQKLHVADLKNFLFMFEIDLLFVIVGRIKGKCTSPILTVWLTYKQGVIIRQRLWYLSYSSLHCIICISDRITIINIIALLMYKRNYCIMFLYFHPFWCTKRTSFALE